MNPLQSGNSPIWRRISLPAKSEADSPAAARTLFTQGASLTLLLGAIVCATAVFVGVAGLALPGAIRDAKDDLFGASAGRCHMCGDPVPNGGYECAECRDVRQY
jgi:hypothetical protein